MKLERVLVITLKDRIIMSATLARQKKTEERREQWIRDVNCSISVASLGRTRSAKTWPAKGSLTSIAEDQK